MRKCPSCGSLLLGDVDACVRCGTPLPAAVGAANPGPTRGLGRLSIPSPVPAPPPSAPAGGAVAEFRESWQPVILPAPVAEPRSTPWGRVALAVAIVLVLGAAVLHLHSDPLPAGTSAFVNGGGITYTSPDGSFQEQLPQAPTSAQQTITVNGESVTVYVATVESANYEMVAASFAFSASVSADRVASALDEVMTEGIAGMKGTVQHKNLTMRGTLPAVEGGFRLSDGYDAKLLAVSSGASLIVVGVHAKSGTSRLFKALEDSLIVR